MKWSLAGMLWLGVAVGTGCASPKAVPPLAQQMERGLALDSSARPAPARTVLRAFAFVSPEDCKGNWQFVNFFGDAGDTVRIPLRGFYLLGPAAFAPEARRLLEQQQLAQPIATPSPRLLASLEVLGPLKTPFVVIVDQQDEIRYAGSSPLTFDTQLAWREFLPVLNRLARMEAEGRARFMD